MLVSENTEIGSISLFLGIRNWNGTLARKSRGVGFLLVPAAPTPAATVTTTTAN